MNKVVLSGYAGADVEVRKFKNKKKLARVNIAVNDVFTTKHGEEIKKTNWFTLNFWNANADIAEQEIKKGSFVSIEGKLETGAYETKEGVKKHIIDIFVYHLLQNGEKKTA